MFDSPVLGALMDVPLCAGGAHPGTRAVPLLDRSVLTGLEDELGGAAGRFAGDFAGLWGRRRARLAGAGLDEALDAVLSLKVSSMMVGARRLAWEAGRLESVLRTGEGNLGALFGQIAECGWRTVEALREAWPGDAEP